MDRVCLVCPHHVAAQPRTLREADTLTEEGFDVRVVSRQTDAELTEADARLAAHRPWRLQVVDLRRRPGSYGAWLSESVRSRIARFLFRAGIRSRSLAARGLLPGMGRLVARAAAEETDLFIAHTQPALPVAVLAADRLGAAMAFDCEDLLAEVDRTNAALIRRIEDEYLSTCTYVSVPSRAMGEHLAVRYGIPDPVTLYNVFPRSARTADGDGNPPALREHDAGLRLHWFSQTVGPGRGLEDAVRALARVGEGVELHLRGRVSRDYRERLLRLGCEGGAEERIHFHGWVDHDELIESLSSFDVGLALERPEHTNHAMTVTNKIFAYLLGGLAVIATDTVGQREILEPYPEVGAMYPAGDVAALAERISRYAEEPASLKRARRAAWELGTQALSWDVERKTFLRAVRDGLGG